MVTLNEIKAIKINRKWTRLGVQIDTVVVDATHFRLLIRAVRQLGDIAEREDWPSYWTGSEWRSIDPDVLALFEEGR